MRKKLLFLLMSAIICFSTLVGCGNSGTDSDNQNSGKTFNDVPVKEITVDPSDANYYESLYEAELYNVKLIRNLPTLYEEDQWKIYVAKAKSLTTMNASALNDYSKGLIDAAKEEREKLVQIKSYEDNVWFIWGDDIANATTPDASKFINTSEDSSDFVPYLLPYLLEDQSQVKGNLIIVSGGGYASRANEGEGYPTAKAMNDLGYNCFVLQRRVSPYSAADTWLDLQRSIRYLRFNAEELGLGASDCIAAVGFSGGSATVLGTVANLYGEVQPTIYDSSYTPDEVDAENSDLTVAIPIYGPNYSMNFGAEYSGLVTENPNIPAMLIMVGQNDNTGATDDCLTLFSSVKDKTDVEMHIFALNGHGFGPGKVGTNSEKWPELAASFMEEIMANQ